MSIGALSGLRGTGRALQHVPRAAAALLALAWMGLIAWLSSIPAADLPAAPWTAFVGNLAHAFLFGLLALWAALSVPRAMGWPKLDLRTSIAIAAFVLAYGIVDEWHQTLTPGREPSVYDLLTDVAGASATLAVAAYAGRGDAREHGLWLRFAAGLASCALAAALSTYGPALR